MVFSDFAVVENHDFENVCESLAASFLSYWKEAGGSNRMKIYIYIYINFSFE